MPKKLKKKKIQNVSSKWPSQLGDAMTNQLTYNVQGTNKIQFMVLTNPFISHPKACV